MSVTIPNEVADAIESFRKDRHDNAYIIYNVSRVIKDNAIGSERVIVLARTIPFDTLMAALINGYEREQTAEQQRAHAHAVIRDKYRRNRLLAGFRIGDSREGKAYADGVQFTLEALGERVAGVNG